MAVFFLEHLLPRAVKGAHREEKRMPDNVYKVEEIVGTSETGLEEAIEGAIDRASKTIKNLDWFEVLEIRGHVVEGEIAHYQVKLKIGFKLID
jgi:dodecin